MKKNIVTFALISGLTGLALAGCGSIYNGPTTYIDFNVENADKVECDITNEKYRYHMIAPQRKMLENSKYPYNIHCYKEGYEDFYGVINPSVSGAHVMNVANAALGVPVDIADHSVFTYPEEFTISMRSALPDHSFSIQSTLITKDPVLDSSRNSTYIQPELKFEYHQNAVPGVSPQTGTTQQQMMVPQQLAPQQLVPQHIVPRANTQNPMMTLPKSILEIEAEEAARQGYRAP